MTMLVEIEPPAQAHFDHRPLETRLGEDDECGGGQKVEPGRLGRRRIGRARGLISVERFIEGARKGRLVDLASLHAHALGHPLDMRRTISPDAKSGMRERRLDQRRDRPLSLGARHMDRAKRFLRVAKPRGKVEHRLEADAHHSARPPLPVGQRVEPRHSASEVQILGRLQHAGDGIVRLTLIDQCRLWESRAAPPRGPSARKSPPKTAPAATGSTQAAWRPKKAQTRRQPPPERTTPSAKQFLARPA